ncbi:MAG TPA: GDSL-type esterase/lipase family protein [Planctomycetota bacterium]|nr:GDSL-type esterase/lipase family protein [Planctomycetota bacterium]
MRTLLVLLVGLALQDKWEAEIQKFEAQDLKNPPPLGGIVFVGSSSIKLWKTQEAFPDLPVLNRGFGGSEMGDAAHFAERIVIAYKPRTVIAFAGGNDIHGGKTPEQVASAFRELVGKVRTALPKTKVYFISLFPNVARASEDEKCRKVNELIREFTKTDERLGYIDVRPRMEGPDGKARPELLRPDGLHMNDDGYKIWNELVGAILKEGK